MEKQFGNLRIGAVSVEQLHQPPLQRRKAEDELGARLLGDDDGLTILEVFFVNHPWIELRRNVAHHPLGQFGQRHVEGANNIHGTLGTWRLARMPGRSPDVSPCNCARISMVSLEGSTTGLTSITRA